VAEIGDGDEGAKLIEIHGISKAARNSTKRFTASQQERRATLLRQPLYGHMAAFAPRSIGNRGDQW
jgi:hypothetical protein